MTTKSAVHFGVKDLGRAFNGLILHQSGYHLTMVGQDEHVVDVLQQLHGYDVEVVGETSNLVHVPCDALHTFDKEVLERLSTCDVVTYSVSLDRYHGVAQVLVDGLRLRIAKNVTKPVNVIACGRVLRATTLLRQLVVDSLSTEEQAYLHQYVGFVDCAWDRIIPSHEQHKGASKQDPLRNEVRIVTEEYFEWVVDDSHVKGELDIQGVKRRTPLQPYVSRSMFLLTAGHAAVAYLGYLKDYKSIKESLEDPEIEKVARGIMLEIAKIEEVKYGFDMTETQEYVDQSIQRFKNPHISDTIARVARDPIRKLDKEERLIKPLLTTIKYSLPNDYLCQVIGAVLHYNHPHDSEAARLHHLVKRLGVEGTLKTVSGVSKDSPTHAQLNEEEVIQKIIAAFDQFGESRPLSPLTPLEVDTMERFTTALRSTTVTSLSTVRKTAVHFGAGKIGRGFIGELLALAGYQVTFADVDKHMVGLLQKLKTYNVQVLGTETSLVQVRDVDAILSTDEKLLEKLATCDLVTTAVGVNILPRIAPVLAKGIQKRCQQGSEDHVNIIACENAVRATTALKAFVLEKLEPADLEYVAKYVGFADSAVDRIVPSMARLADQTTETEEEEVAVAVEEFFEWDVDETQMKGEGYLGGVRDIDGLTLCDNLQAYVERKLFTLNTGHATTAYLGYLKGYKMIEESINDEDIQKVVKGAMQESAEVLIRKYGFNPTTHAQYIERILRRFQNPFLRDEVTRVGRDPIRKLGMDDRLFKPLLGTLEYGLPNTNLCKAIAAALRFTYEGDPQAIKLQSMITEDGVTGALGKILPVAEKKIGGEVMDRILAEYNALADTK